MLCVLRPPESTKTITPSHQYQTVRVGANLYFQLRATVEPRFNEPLFNKVLDVTNEILRPGQSYFC